MTKAINSKLPPGVNSLVEKNRYYWDKDPVVYKPMEKLDKKRPIVVDLFSGMGGLSLGFEMAGFQAALGVDIHEPSIETFRYSHPRAAAILGDITKMVPLNSGDEGNLLTETLAQVVGNRDVDALVAGIPCQGFSMTNKKRHVLDERNYLFLYFIRCAELIKPKFILIENVSALQSMDNGSFVEGIKNNLETIGYRGAEEHILNAADFGVPQKRTRIFFFASREGHNFVCPRKTHGGESRPHLTVKDAIYDLPRLKPRESAREHGEQSELTDYQISMRRHSPALHNHRAPNHPPSTTENIENTRPGAPMYKSYKQRIRLSWDAPSPTQVSGGIRPQFQFGHPEDCRGLTVRERCRLQSIPDWVVVHGGIVQGRVQTGNAVPPLLAKAIARNIRFELMKDTIVERVLSWGKRHRRDFPWRNEKATPYEILVAEFLLRKTKAEMVKNVYQKFISNFPTPESLLTADSQSLELLLKPLGLSKIRSRGLIRVAEKLNNGFGGEVPMSAQELEDIPHIGRYISNATLMFGHGLRKPVVDENIQRVFKRLFDIPKAVELHKSKEHWELMESLLPDEKFKEFTWGLLDLAAKVCKPKTPSHEECPVNDFCAYYRRWSEHV